MKTQEQPTSPIEIITAGNESVKFFVYEQQRIGFEKGRIKYAPSRL